MSPTRSNFGIKVGSFWILYCAQISNTCPMISTFISARLISVASAFSGCFKATNFRTFYRFNYLKYAEGIL